MMSKALLFALLACSSATALASAPVASRDQGLPRILRLQTEIAERVEHAGGALSPRQRQTIRMEQKRIRGIVEGRGSLDELSQEQRVALINAQERINAAIRGTREAEDARLVCRRGRPTGSQVTRLRCATVGQDNRLREYADRDADGDLLEN